MHAEQQEWPDANGTLVGLGDWIEVWCTWTNQPKFEGRAVQVVDVLCGNGQAVFRLRDPEGEVDNQFIPACSSGYRKVSARQSGVVARTDTGVTPDQTQTRRVQRG